ncbi:MAG TPA: lytic transglycosylase domain-containing protein [Thermoanaerobaculia bacterium]
MKRPLRLRSPLTLLAAAFFLALTFASTPSDPAPSDPNMTPPPAEPQELASFLVAGTGTASDGRFHAFRTADLTAASAPAPEPRRLSLLAPGADDLETRRRFLHHLPYGTAIAAAAERHHVDGLLLAAIVEVESDFSARAVSSQGALGLMQVIPDVAQDYGVEGDLLDPYVNLDVGSRYVDGLLKDYKGDLQMALAAYNAGPGVVDRYKGVPPYAETRSFVRDVLAQYAAYNRKLAARGVKAAGGAARAAYPHSPVPPSRPERLQALSAR